MQSLEIAGLAVSVTHVLIVLAVGVALLTASFVGRSEGTAVGDIIWRMLLVGVVAARTAFVVQYFEIYQDNPLSMLDIRDGGFKPLFGVLAGLLVGAWSAMRRPRLRRPLAVAVSAGTLAWGLTTGALMLMHNQSRSLPAITFTTLGGSKITLRELSGEPMVVNLWASWCPPCRREMPILGRAQERYSDITFVFVNQGESARRIRAYLRHENLTLDHVLLDPSSQLGQWLGSRALPTTLFYNARGKLVSQHLGALSQATLLNNLKEFDRFAPDKPRSSHATTEPSTS